jgi:hypothetical protein
MPDVPCPGPGWKKNAGHQPKNSRGKRVRIVLNHGREGKYDNNPMSPPGWAADKAGWKLDDKFPFAIAWYLTL